MSLSDFQTFTALALSMFSLSILSLNSLHNLLYNILCSYKFTMNRSNSTIQYWRCVDYKNGCK